LEMDNQPEATILRLRPHHIFCLPFLTLDGDSIGRGFFEVLTKVKWQLMSQPTLMVTTIEGVDDICKACPSCVDGECDSTLIKEEKVRRLDALLLAELGKSYGDTLRVAQWQSVISKKWPYRLCRVCRWREYCGSQVT